MKADVPPAEAEDGGRAGAARPGGCSPSRTTVVLAAFVAVLILLALQPGTASQGVQPVAHMALSDVLRERERRVGQPAAAPPRRAQLQKGGEERR